MAKYYGYIERVYGTTFQSGERVKYKSGPVGTVKRPIGDPQYSRVRHDGQKHGSKLAPPRNADNGGRRMTPLTAMHWTFASLAVLLLAAGVWLDFRHEDAAPRGYSADTPLSEARPVARSNTHDR